MPRRIDVELTSRRDDGNWTWRAAGAKEPRGTLDGALLPEGVSVGTVVKAEVELDIDGITVTAVQAPKGARPEPKRIEIIGRPRDDEQLVTTTLAPKRGGRRDGDRRDRPGRGDRGERGGERRDRRGGPDDRRGGARPGGGPRRDGDRRPREAAPVEQRPKARRLRPGRVHRDAVLAGLADAERPIAEELVRGGVPAVRTALERQNETAKAEGRPVIDPGPLLTLAERLWPRVRDAEWRDRAEAALRDVEDLDLRDLRSVVVASESSARDDETRALAEQLRTALTRRVDAEQEAWLGELGELVRGGRVVAALRRSARPPKAGSPIPEELATALAAATTASFTPEITTQRWVTLLDALAHSPVRTRVTPAAVPEQPDDELVAAVRKVADRLPEIAALFGVTPAPATGATRRRGKPVRPGAAPKAPPAAAQEDAPNPADDVGAGAGAAETAEAAAEVAAEAAPSAEVSDSEAS